MNGLWYFIMPFDSDIAQEVEYGEWSMAEMKYTLCESC